MTHRVKEIRAIVLGSKGAGKSRLCNAILGLDPSNDEDDHFLEYKDRTGGSAYQNQRLLREIEGIRVQIVDTPGIDNGNIQTRTDWKNMVHAFDMIGQTVDSFIIVVDANSAASNIIGFFLKMFGETAKINAHVVYLNNPFRETSNCDRILEVNHSYLRSAGIPSVDCPSLKKSGQCQKLVLDKMKKTADGIRYTVDHFRNPQTKFAINWVHHSKPRDKVLTKFKCIELGVPDILLSRLGGRDDELLRKINAGKL